MRKRKKPAAPTPAPTLEEHGRIVHQMNPEAMAEAERAAAEAKRQAKETRAYVLERFLNLRGCTIPVEIFDITNLPSHNCLLINDHILFAYSEAKFLLEQIDEQEA